MVGAVPAVPGGPSYPDQKKTHQSVYLIMTDILLLDLEKFVTKKKVGAFSKKSVIFF